MWAANNLDKVTGILGDRYTTDAQQNISVKLRDKFKDTDTEKWLVMGITLGSQVISMQAYKETKC
ncbi:MULTISPECIES: hypothetical protein [Cysteiniphilum]|uniref:Uncharacterized protein n=1 Tax=Cysteiniphilum litorale TaxID=2056700 RepID=A0A8J2Z3X2_9GAMM|nr:MULTISPECIES: hypothetical protein [Cysteiniphilum]GGF93368.1 hypothetical protein GCM10010995_08120 [Cysteiniphilum litorale]